MDHHEEGPDISEGTRNIGIIFQNDPSTVHTQHKFMTTWGFCDANYAEDSHDQKSMSSYAFMLAGSLISWKSKKQASIALSTTEAEYYVLGIACQEAA